MLLFLSFIVFVLSIITYLYMKFSSNLFNKNFNSMYECGFFSLMEWFGWSFTIHVYCYMILFLILDLEVLVVLMMMFTNYYHNYLLIYFIISLGALMVWEWFIEMMDWLNKSINMYSKIYPKNIY